MDVSPTRANAAGLRIAPVFRASLLLLLLGAFEPARASPLTLSPAALPGGSVSSLYSHSLSASGGTPPFFPGDQLYYETLVGGLAGIPTPLFAFAGFAPQDLRFADFNGDGIADTFVMFNCETIFADNYD